MDKKDKIMKNPNFGQKLKYWSEIDILVKSRNFVGKSQYFGQKS